MKAHIVTLGCPKNLVDSEATATLLMGAGCTLTDEPGEADLLLVGACSFLDASWQETVEEVRRLAEFKTGDKRLVLMGCLPRHRDENLAASLPQVDHFVPTGGQSQLPELVRKWNAGSGTAKMVATAEDRFAGFENRMLFTPSHTAYVKVAEGCNRKCTFCAIPTIRGRQETRSIDAIVREVEGHVAAGVKEVTLLAQDIVSYTDNGRKLHDLVAAIDATGIEWIRIFYFHPAGIEPDYVARVFDIPSVCRYLEMPVQHASTRLLQRMKRSYDRGHVESLLRGIRGRYPDVVIRSEVIVGFPGETDTEFDELMDFTSEFEFDSLGIFPYSREPGTEAAGMPEQLPDTVIRDRVEELVRHQEAIAFGARARFEGRCLRVLVDGSAGEVEDDHRWSGRFYGQAPDVDGDIQIASSRELATGEFVDVTITDAGPYDLRGIANTDPCSEVSI